MTRKIDNDKRYELLDQAAGVLAETGLIDTSLRTLATRMGTSARMLVYYFGSKENLIVLVLAHEQSKFEQAPSVSSDIEGLRKYLFQDWEALTRGHKQSGVRILVQLFGAACAQESTYKRYTAETMTHLRNGLSTRLQVIGLPKEIAHQRGRFATAALQGILIDYFTTADTVEADHTFEHLVDHVLLAPH